MLLLVEDYYDSISTSRQENAVNSHLFFTVHSKLHPEALHKQQREGKWRQAARYPYQKLYCIRAQTQFSLGKIINIIFSSPQSENSFSFLKEAIRCNKFKTFIGSNESRSHQDVCDPIHRERGSLTGLMSMKRCESGDLCSHQISTKLNTCGRFWANVLDVFV